MAYEQTKKENESLNQMIIQLKKELDESKVKSFKFFQFQRVARINHLFIFFFSFSNSETNRIAIVRRLWTKE